MHATLFMTNTSTAKVHEYDDFVMLHVDEGPGGGSAFVHIHSVANAELLLARVTAARDAFVKIENDRVQHALALAAGQLSDRGIGFEAEQEIFAAVEAGVRAGDGIHVAIAEAMEKHAPVDSADVEPDECPRCGGHIGHLMVSGDWYCTVCGVVADAWDGTNEAALRIAEHTGNDEHLIPPACGYQVVPSR